MTTLSEIHQKVSEYLNGELDLDDFMEWVEPRDDEMRRQHWEEHPFEKEYVIPDIPVTARDILAAIELMHCEMVCSGSFRTEEMFRADLRSILDGKPQTAFQLDWQKYTEWCEQRERDIQKLLGK